MRAARFYGPEDVRIDEVPEPKPKEGQVKIKVYLLAKLPSYLRHSDDLLAVDWLVRYFVGSTSFIATNSGHVG